MVWSTLNEHFVPGVKVSLAGEMGKYIRWKISKGSPNASFMEKILVLFLIMGTLQENILLYVNIFIVIENQ